MAGVVDDFGGIFKRRKVAFVAALCYSLFILGLPLCTGVSEEPSACDCSIPFSVLTYAVMMNTGPAYDWLARVAIPPEDLQE